MRVKAGEGIGAVAVAALAVFLVAAFAAAVCALPAGEAWAQSGSVPFTASVPELPSDAKESSSSSSSSSAAAALVTPAKSIAETSAMLFFSYLPNPTTEAFIESICEDARRIGQKRGLYASVMIAQAILESGSGSSGLSKPPYNNLFGIKGSYRGRSVTMGTSEDDGTGAKYDISSAFRSYPSVRESLNDYADLLTVQMASFYAPVWKANAKTYREACDYLQGHYATDTTYSAKVQALITAYKLTQYDHPKGSKEAEDAKAGEDGEAVLEVSRVTLPSAAASSSLSHETSLRTAPWTASWVAVAVLAVALVVLLCLSVRLAFVLRRKHASPDGDSRG